ncbi:MAG: DUF502 domain-containing protein [Halodesulfurarchaeum sp.]
MPSWKRDFASGLVVLVPILVTLYVVYWVVSFVYSVVPVAAIFGNPQVGALLTLLIFLLVVLTVGYLMRTAIGSILEGYIDRVFNHLPGLRIVYNASKMAVETALTGTEDLQAPVRLEVWDGLRMTAFKTGKRTVDGREILFLPTSPNITTGYVIEVGDGRYEEIDESVEEALTRVLSAGFGDNGKGDLASTLLGSDPEKESRLLDAVGKSAEESVAEESEAEKSVAEESEAEESVAEESEAEKSAADSEVVEDGQASASDATRT